MVPNAPEKYLPHPFAEQFVYRRIRTRPQPAAHPCLPVTNPL